MLRTFVPVIPHEQALTLIVTIYWPQRVKPSRIVLAVPFYKKTDECVRPYVNFLAAAAGAAVATAVAGHDGAAEAATGGVAMSTPSGLCRGPANCPLNSLR